MSYQKNGGNGAAYQPINGDAKSGSSKKWVFGTAIVVIAGIVGYMALGSKPGAATDAAVAKADLPKSKTGKLKLFDENSKWRIFLTRNGHKAFRSSFSAFFAIRTIPYGRF